MSNKQQGPELRKTPAGDDLLARDSKVMIRPWSGSGEPVPVVSARGCEVTDAHGNTFLDMTSGYFVNQAGHCHPEIAAAVNLQMTKVTQVSGRHTTPAAIELAEKLVETTPKSLNKVFFTTSGSESNEFAFKMVRQRQKKSDLAVLDNAYHGLSLGVLAACANKTYRDSAGVDMGDFVYRLPAPYCYRCKHVEDCATQCLDGVEAQFDARPNTAALVAESVQAVGGIIPPEAWWSRLDRIRRDKGILLVLDEVQTGVGRTGAMFAAEHYGLEPDVMTAGKGLSGGVGSLAAVVANDRVVEGFFGGTTPTSAGNAVSAAAGLALIGLIEREGLIANARRMGEYLGGAARDLNDPWIGDVRFKGLLGGVELVSDRESKAVLPKAQVEAVKQYLHRHGMLITVSGPHGNVLRLQPSLCVTAAQLDTFVGHLKGALGAVRAQTSLTT